MKVCVKDYPTVEEAGAGRAQLQQPMHGTTQVSPRVASNAHPLTEPHNDMWCLLVDAQYAAEAKKILGVSAS